MTALGAEEIRTRVESDFSRIVDVLNQKIALQSISAKGITADHMKRSAQFVADLLREVGVDTKVVQSHNPDGTPGAWEVIGSKNVSEDAPTVLLYAHHDVQPVPIRAYGTPTRSSALKSTRVCTAAEPRTTAVESPFIPVR